MPYIIPSARSSIARWAIKAIKLYNSSSIIVLHWPNGGNVQHNWGDKLNPELVNHLSGLPVANVNSVVGWGDRPVYRVIGSNLKQMRPNEVVWGMGFIRYNTVPKKMAARICAVRGPMSRDRLLELGIPCPDVFGDPAILYPLFYWPPIEKRFDVGIIQHFREIDTVPPVRVADGLSVKRIDIRSGVTEFVDHVLSCRSIVSSSLHGVICAHAYGLPAHWLKASDLPLGDDFKFHDYFASIGHERIRPATIDTGGYVDFADSPCVPGDVLIDADALIDACPFIENGRKRELKRRRRRLASKGRRGIIFMETTGPANSSEPDPSR